MQASVKRFLLQQSTTSHRALLCNSRCLLNTTPYHNKNNHNSHRLFHIAHPSLFNASPITPSTAEATTTTSTPSSSTSVSTTTTTTTTSSSSAEQLKPRGRILFITLANSRFHKSKHLTEAFKVLGLKLINQTVVHKDTPSIRGLVFRVRNFVTVESVSTAELFPEGTEHIQVERKSRSDMRKEWVAQKKEQRHNTAAHLEEAERVVAEYKRKQQAKQQQQQ